MSPQKVVKLPVNVRRFLKTRLKRAHKALGYDDVRRKRHKRKVLQRFSNGFC